MLARNRGDTRWTLLLGAFAAWACADAPTETAGEAPPVSRQTTHFRDALAATRWNQRATVLLQGTVSDDLPLGVPGPPNGQAWASRMLTYLSLAQYRAALVAAVPSNSMAHENSPEIPRVSSAVAGASFTMLYAFFAARSDLSEPVRNQILDFLTRKFDEDASTPGFVESGNSIGRMVAEAVLAQAATDRYGAIPLPPRPTGEGYWVPGTGTIVRSLYGVRPFFLEEDELLLEREPPVYGSEMFLAAVAEVLAIVEARTPEQLAIAANWNKVAPAGPFTAGEWNRTADGLIESYALTELQAARILAYANAAAFDAQIVCFTTKFHWWYLRPAQADVRILPLLAFTTPNHPSYPSAHSCISSAFVAMLSHAFPSERNQLDALLEEAGLSRIYAGIHYRFDIEGGVDVGELAAAKALAGSLE